MTAAAKSARQIQADDTRARLFAAAAELFSQKGYHETTVDQIARQAGVAKGTFFNHFATKDAVVMELVRLQLRAARKARQSAGPDPVARLRACVLTLGEQAGMSRELSRAVLSASLENPDVGGGADALFGEVFADMIEDARAAQKAKLLVATPDAKTLAAALMASYLGAALHFTTSPPAQALAPLLASLVDAILAGFARGASKPKEAPHVPPRHPAPRLRLARRAR